MAESHDEIEVQEPSEGESAVGCGKWYRWWWKCDNKAVVSEFLTESSLHGLKYIGQPKRNIVERVFWIVTFIVGVAAAGFLIHQLFTRYKESPVIVSFQSEEQSVNTIPFPAVTFCFNLQFTKEKVESLKRKTDGSMEIESYLANSEKLELIDSICDSRKSFFREYFGDTFYKNNARNDYYYSKNQSKLQQEIIDLLLEYTPSCKDMIPFVRLDGSNIFKPIEIFNPVITEYGKCCTFNMLPTPLMLKQPSVGNENEGDIFSNSVLGTKSKQWWKQTDIDDWQKWNYEEGFRLIPDRYKSEISWVDIKLSHPYRNQRLGYSFGLSVVINTFEPYCDDVTFHGTTFMLHNPVDTPRLSQFPSLIGSKQEVFIKIHPDITFADPDIKDVKIEKRQCFFGKEQIEGPKLKYFRPYSQENCFEDCIADLIETECSCSMFYMPRPKETLLCQLHSDTTEGKCVSDTLNLLSKKNKCEHCLPLCEYIDYNFEMSNAKILDWYPSILRKFSGFVYDWTGQWNQTSNDIYQSTSIVHIFYESPSTVPKLRKRLYGLTDLIANTGGILGLCLGFSVLSVAEVLYYVLMRTIWQILSRHCVGCNTKAATAFGTTATIELETHAKSSDKKAKFKRTNQSGKYCCKKRSVLFRFNWLCCILVGSVTSGFLFYMLVIEKNENTNDTFKVPLETSKDSNHYWAEATFCYVNQFSMEKVLELRRVAEFTTDENHRYSAETNLSIIDAMCKYIDDLETSSTNKFHPVNPDVANYTFLLKFLDENTIPCSQMFPTCVYMGMVQENCNKIIKPVYTAYGKCCRIMMVPTQPKFAISDDDKMANNTVQLNARLNLNLTDYQNYKLENSPLFNGAKFTSSYFLVHGANLPEEFSAYIKPFHFSVLSSLNQDYYQCGNTNTATNQILFSLDSPGKFPQIQDLSSLLVANEEVVLTVFPEAVSSDSPDEVINNESRKCTPYPFWPETEGWNNFQSTEAAELDICSREFLSSNCKCALFGIKKQFGSSLISSRTCKTGSNSNDTICLKKMNELVRKMKHICSCTGRNCKKTCRGTSYSYTKTNQLMRNASQLWASLIKFGNDTTSMIPWATNKTGIIHFTFDTTRKTLNLTNNDTSLRNSIVDWGGFLGIILMTVVSSLICFSLIVFRQHFWWCISGMILKPTQYLHEALNARKT